MAQKTDTNYFSREGKDTEVTVGRQPNIFICGFIEKRLHNATLYQITHDLMSYFFVSGNSPDKSKWSRDIVIRQLAAADVVLFLLNEFTLKDAYCLLALQYAWEMRIPIQMIRSARMRLVINPLIPNGIDKITDKTSLNGESPDLYLLQDIMYECYKASVKYDRLERAVSTKRLLKRLQEVTQQPRNAFAALDDTAGPKVERSCSNGLSNTKLPPILRKRSQSLVMPEKMGTLSGRGSRATETSNSGDQQSLSEFGLRNDSRNTDDPTLFHSTQYLIFPFHSKEQKPKLIRFPEDMPIHGNASDDNDLEIRSIWGSDTSLEEEVSRSAQLQGNIDIPSPPSTPVHSLR